MADASALTDAQIERVVQGDREAMEALMHQISPQVYRMAVARLGPRPDQWHAVDEIVQESLLALTTGLPTLERRTVGGFRAYLSRIVENKVVDRIRRQGKPGRHTGSLQSLNSTVAYVSSAGQFGQFLSASGLGPRTDIAQQEQVQEMFTHLAQLKPEHQQVITLSLFDQLKTAEIAQRMNISRPAASMLLIRAIDALRRRMQSSKSEPEGGHGT